MMMLQKVKILTQTSHDGFGYNYQERTLDVEIPDSWAALDEPATKAMMLLLTHYLQNRWWEQYNNCCKGTQKAIQTGTLRKRAVEDLKTEIAHDTCCNNLQQLSTNMVRVNERVQKEIAEQAVQWDKDHPLILDESYPQQERTTSLGL
jgi:hypothetical protein